jgi:hypothetical protein
MIAIAPTATIAAIAGSYECIEPQVSATDNSNADVKAYSDQEALVCSLENPEACEACQ